MTSPLDIYGLKSSTTIHMGRMEADFSDIPRGSLRGSRPKPTKDDSEHSLSSHGKIHCVCFDLEPELHYIELREELPEVIIEAVWYDEDDMKAMIAAATAVLAGTNTEDAPRGLEHYSYEGAQRRRAERSKASEAVLGEQLRQQAMKACENAVFRDADELIRQEYIKVSTKQQEKAVQRARTDEAEASDNKLLHRLSSFKNWFSSDRQLVPAL